MSMRVFSRPEEIRQLEELVNHVIAFEMQEAMRDHNESTNDICRTGLEAQDKLKSFLQTIKLYSGE